MRLAELIMNPLRISARSLRESLYQALNPVSAQSRCGGCAGPQCSAYQIGIFTAEPDATVFHGAYDPIVAWRCQ